MTKRKIRFKRGFGGGALAEVSLGEYIQHDISRSSSMTSGQVEALRDEVDELRGYFERLLDIIEPDLSEAEIFRLCKKDNYNHDNFEIVEVEEAFVVAEEDEDLEEDDD